MLAKTRILACALALCSAACATGQSVSVYGRSVTVRADPSAPDVKGELVAVTDSQLLVREKGELRELPLASVREVRVKRNSHGRSYGWAWTGIGAALTGGGMAFACSSVEGNSGCAGVGGLFALAWAVVGGLSAESMESHSRYRLAQPSAESLRPFARFPQGIPPGLDTALLKGPDDSRPRE
jgi:hypothetical protein